MIGGKVSRATGLQDRAFVGVTSKSGISAHLASQVAGHRVDVSADPYTSRRNTRKRTQGHPSCRLGTDLARHRASLRPRRPNAVIDIVSMVSINGRFCRSRIDRGSCAKSVRLAHRVVKSAGWLRA